MSGDAQPAEIDGEYRCEEKRKQKALDSKHTAPKLTTQHSAKPYGVNLSTGYFKSDGVDHQQLPTDLHKCVGESHLATVKRSKLLSTLTTLHQLLSLASLWLSTILPVLMTSQTLSTISSLSKISTFHQPATPTSLLSSRLPSSLLTTESKTTTSVRSILSAKQEATSVIPGSSFPTCR